ncbi:MAG: hypothetical protein ACRDPR_20150, partial [Nocardioidaceae bacterium]
TYAALVVGRAVDIHGDPLPVVDARCTRGGTRTRLASGGQWVVSGETARVLPNLATAPDVLRVILTVRNRPALTVDVPVPQGAVLPVQHGHVYVPARPVAIAGQVRRLDLAHAPIADALVRSVVDAAVPGLIPLALRTGLWAARPALTTTLRTATVTPTVAATALPGGARAGDTVFVLANTTGVVAGAIVRFTPGLREHYGVVRELIDGVTVLSAPLSASVPPGGEARVVTVAPTGPTRSLSRPGEAGDGLLALDADLPGDVVRLVDATALEVHAVGARTDATGYYRLSGVRGVPLVALRASAVGLASTQPATVCRVDEHTLNDVDLGIQP